MVIGYMKIEDAVSTLKNVKFVHSIILFGSRAKGTGRRDSDVDLCIIPNPRTDVSLKDRISLENLLPEKIDLSLLTKLPVTIQRRVFLEGKVLYTKDLYYVLTLSKENEMEYMRYGNLKRNYHKAAMKRVRAKVG